jgi:hypothetical protein
MPGLLRTLGGQFKIKFHSRIWLGKEAWRLEFSKEIYGRALSNLISTN